MDRGYDKRHSKHHKEKHKKHAHKKYKNKGGQDQSYATINSVKPLVEYSDVSSEALSAPEAGEIESEASSISRHIADDLDRTRKSHPVRTFVDNKTISVSTTSSRRVGDEYAVSREVLASRKRRSGYVEEDAEFDEHRYKKKKEKRKKDKKKRKKKSKHHSRSASLESVSPDDNMPSETPVRTSPQRYQKVPISEWEKGSSPLPNGSCSPVSPSTPPPRERHELSLPHRIPHIDPALLRNPMPFSPHRERSPAPIIVR